MKSCLKTADAGAAVRQTDTVKEGRVGKRRSARFSNVVATREINHREDQAIDKVVFTDEHRAQFNRGFKDVLASGVKLESIDGSQRAMKRKLTKAETTIGDLEARLAAEKGTSEGLRSEVASLQESFSLLCDQSDAHQDEREALETKNAALEAEIAALRARMPPPTFFVEEAATPDFSFDAHGPGPAGPMLFEGPAEHMLKAFEPATGYADERALLAAPYAYATPAPSPEGGEHGFDQGTSMFDKEDVFVAGAPEFSDAQWAERLNLLKDI